MTELSGTLEGVGLPAIVRFLSALHKSGALRMTHEDWRGEVFFDAGRVVSASLGTRHGVSALDALVQALPGAAFTFDADARYTGTPDIQLSQRELELHLDELVAQAASGGPGLPSLDAIPQIVAQDDDGASEEQLPLDRGTLQTLIAVDGSRSVREIIAARGSFEALWQLATLVQLGLVRLAAPPASATPPPAQAVREPLGGFGSRPAQQPVRSPARTAAVAAAAAGTASPAGGHCPKLGFEDDSTHSFGRPTRLHRCFAAGAPLPLSLDQQRDLCLSEQYPSCPRLQPGSTPVSSPNRPARRFSAPVAAAAATDAATDDPRIVRLPVGPRPGTPPRDRGPAAETTSTTEPAPLHPVPTPTASPTPLRARGTPAAAVGSQLSDVAPAARPEAAAAQVRTPPPPPPPTTPPPGRRSFLPFDLPITATIVGLLVVALVAVLLAPNLLGVFSDPDAVDLTSLPNSNALVAGTPVSELAAALPTPEPVRLNPTAAIAVPPAEPTAAPSTERNPTSPPPAAAVAAAGPRTLLDEAFDENARDWPSNQQGTAWLTGGAYRMAPRAAAQFVAIGAPLTDMLQDVIVSATFRKVGGPAGGGYGIIVRDQGPGPRDGVNQGGRYYVLEAGDQGEVGIWRRDNDRWVDLLPWERSADVRPGAAANELIVKAIGDTLSLTVNGKEVGTRIDSTLPVGSVGLFVGGDGNQVTVDHFTVQTP